MDFVNNQEVYNFDLHKLQYENEEQYIWRLGQLKDSGDIDISWDKLANIINREFGYDDRPLSEAAFRKPYQQAKRFYEAGVFDNDSKKSETEIKYDYNTETTINKDGTYSSKRLLVMNDSESKNPDFILKAHGFEPDLWKIVSLRNNIRQVISKQDGVVTLYASFLTVKPTTELTLNQINKFYDELIQKDNRPKINKYTTATTATSDKVMVEVPIVDLHFGKLSFSEDVYEPYNYNLAMDRFNYVIDDVIENVKHLNIEKIIFPIGSDFFHIDNVNRTTTAGTQQDCDLSPQLIFKYGVECLIDGINKLSQLAPVEVFCVNGNHDFLTSYHAICSLWCYYHNNENVYVNRDTSPRKYIEYGNSLIGFAHGDKEKKRIEGIMQVEAREAWGRTIYKEFHLGHLHSEQVQETNGIIIRNLSSVTGTDLWHHNSGYVGAIKKSQTFVWDKEYGLKTIINTIIK